MRNSLESVYLGTLSFSKQYPEYTYCILYVNEQDGYLSNLYHDEHVCDFHKENTPSYSTPEHPYATILAIKNGEEVNIPVENIQREMSAKELRQIQAIRHNEKVFQERTNARKLNLAGPLPEYQYIGE